MSGFKVQVKGHNVRELSRAMRALGADIKAINQRTLAKVGLKAERIVVLHLQSQDLPWAALSTKYKARKIKAGLSEKTLIQTSTYLQSITSERLGNSVSVGVKKDAKEPGGQFVASIAAVLEFGSLRRGIPARPLWGPSLRELAQWITDENLFVREIRAGLLKKYGGKVPGGSEGEVPDVPAPTVSSSPAAPVHTGKRGGRYTLSASGRRQYQRRK